MNRTNHTLRYLMLVFILAVASGAGIILKSGFDRRLFYFPVYGSDEIVIEERYLDKKYTGDKVRNYVDELLLGPVTERARPIFNKGTKAQYCFIRNHVLYLGVTDTVIDNLAEDSTVSKDIELLKTNVRKNFSNIRDVVFFIGNNETF